MCEVGFFAEMAMLLMSMEMMNKIRNLYEQFCYIFNVDGVGIVGYWLHCSGLLPWTDVAEKFADVFKFGEVIVLGENLLFCHFGN